MFPKIACTAGRGKNGCHSYSTSTWIDSGQRSCEEVGPEFVLCPMGLREKRCGLKWACLDYRERRGGPKAGGLASVRLVRRDKRGMGKRVDQLLHATRVQNRR